MDKHTPLMVIIYISIYRRAGTYIYTYNKGHISPNSIRHVHRYTDNLSLSWVEKLLGP